MNYCTWDNMYAPLNLFVGISADFKKTPQNQNQNIDQNREHNDHSSIYTPNKNNVGTTATTTPNNNGDIGQSKGQRSILATPLSRGASINISPSKTNVNVDKDGGGGGVRSMSRQNSSTSSPSSSVLFNEKQQSLYQSLPSSPFLYDRPPTVPGWLNTSNMTPSPNMNIDSSNMNMNMNTTNLNTPFSSQITSNDERILNVGLIMESSPSPYILNPILSNLFKVTHINLQNYGLTGKLPKSIANLDQLQVLDVSNNKFVGCVPSEIASLNNLTRLNLSNNQFEGNALNRLVSVSEEVESDDEADLIKYTEKEDFKKKYKSKKLGTSTANLNDMDLNEDKEREEELQIEKDDIELKSFVYGLRCSVTLGDISVSDFSARTKDVFLSAASAALIVPKSWIKMVQVNQATPTPVLSPKTPKQQQNQRNSKPSSSAFQVTTSNNNINAGGGGGDELSVSTPAPKLANKSPSLTTNKRQSFIAPPIPSGVIIDISISHIKTIKKQQRINDRIIYDFATELSAEGLGQSCSCSIPVKYDIIPKNTANDNNNENELKNRPKWYQIKPNINWKHIGQLPKLQELYLGGNDCLSFPKEVACFGFAQMSALNMLVETYENALACQKSQDDVYPIIEMGLAYRNGLSIDTTNNGNNDNQSFDLSSRGSTSFRESPTNNRQTMNDDDSNNDVRDNDEEEYDDEEDDEEDDDDAFSGSYGSSSYTPSTFTQNGDLIQMNDKEGDYSATNILNKNSITSMKSKQSSLMKYLKIELLPWLKIGHEESFVWFERAASPPFEDPKAMFLLGQCYWRGEGVKTSAAKALDWWRKADVLGDSEAQVTLVDINRALSMIVANAASTQLTASMIRAWAKLCNRNLPNSGLSDKAKEAQNGRKRLAAFDWLGVSRKARGQPRHRGVGPKAKIVTEIRRDAFLSLLEMAYSATRNRTQNELIRVASIAQLGFTHIVLNGDNGLRRKEASSYFNKVMNRLFRYHLKRRFMEEKN
eukprot:CAMPEP_0114381498 /NCGR_PEP_ID=MMETSP0102-20121206/3486_1 /TAXON_ID=38822 ORGANISM="Pteridomonas danica, Strain PT" /NCGR_SAMPLE_ID=MMETSP0102 /ASSEMBLY_ACC=CAM_ASM_000212 /LENGTH=989 /DNA_ID=CAMNT_0001536993 /DNA_START=1465 /DNA_END=4435 /DNA_ORIENTATION=-